MFLSFPHKKQNKREDCYAKDIFIHFALKLLNLDIKLYGYQDLKDTRKDMLGGMKIRGKVQIGNTFSPLSRAYVYTQYEL